MTRPEYLALVAAWPIEARQAFGETFNRLAQPGLGNYLDAERRAFAETTARLAAGAFSPLTPQPQPSSLRPGRRAPAPGLTGLGFEGRKDY